MTTDQVQNINEQTKKNCCSNCCKKYHPRCPYTHIALVTELCCIGCDKPGIGSNEHDPYDNDCSDCAIFCCPCALVADVLCCIPMCFGFYNVTKPK